MMNFSRTILPKLAKLLQFQYFAGTWKRNVFKSQSPPGFQIDISDSAKVKELCSCMSHFTQVHAFGQISDELIGDCLMQLCLEATNVMFRDGRNRNIFICYVTIYWSNFSRVNCQKLIWYKINGQLWFFRNVDSCAV